MHVFTIPPCKTAFNAKGDASTSITNTLHEFIMSALCLGLFFYSYSKNINTVLLWSQYKGIDCNLINNTL
jgi:hypothetical protein